jgi:sugar lactone lactonase YvrE
MGRSRTNEEASVSARIETASIDRGSRMSHETKRLWRTVLAVAMSLATVCCAAAPASADPTGEPPVISADSLFNLPTPTPGAATGEEIEAIRDAFDVSGAQAETNLAVQRRGTKVNIVEQLSQRLGAEYGGIWFDAEAGEFVVPVSTAGETRAATEAATQIVAQEFVAASLGGSFRTEEVLSSEAELEAAQIDLTERLSDYFEAHLAQTALDPAVNALIVRVPESIDYQALAEIEKIASTSAVKVEVRRMPDDAFKVSPAACNEAERKCDLPLRSGQVIYGGPFSGPGGGTFYEICTVGFRANGNDGKKYVLTAGHCVLQNAQVGGTPIWSWMTQSPNEGQNSIGVTNQWHYDGKDWAKIDATGTWADTAPWPTMGAYWGATQEYPISGEASSYKGQTLCHIGVNTGISCGIVKEVNVTVKYGDGAQLNSMYEVVGSGLALGGGDSGGPVVANNIALGIVSGGISAYSNATLYFSDIMAANAELNTNIVGPGAPEAITGEASGIKTYEATISGQVNPHGMPTTYIVEYGIGGYSHSTGPYYAGAGQGFVSVTNVPLSGLEPGTTYQYRVKAGNGLSSGVGAKGTFKTYSWPLVDGNLPTLNISGKQATIRASVRPNKLPTTYWFEYGTTPSLGKETPLGNAGSALGPVEVSHTLTGLIPLTQYYYRVVVNNESSYSVGPTGNFTTGQPAWTYLSRFGAKGTEPGQFKAISGVAVDTAGNAYVADKSNNRVQKFSPTGEFLLQFGVKGSGPGELSTPVSIAIDPQGDVWVGEEGNQRIQEFSPTGTFIRQIGPNEGTNRPKRPNAITIGGNGKVYVADWAAPESILEYNPTPNGEGKYFLKRRVFENRPLGLTTASSGTVYFVSQDQRRVMRVSSSGIELVFEIPAVTSPAFNPAGLAVDPQGNFLISSVNNGSVVQVSASGKVQGSFGTQGTGPGQMYLPASLALAPSGLLFVGSQSTNYPEVTRWAD